MLQMHANKVKFEIYIEIYLQISCIRMYLKLVNEQCISMQLLCFMFAKLDFYRRLVAFKFGFINIVIACRSKRSI